MECGCGKVPVRQVSLGLKSRSSTQLFAGWPGAAGEAFGHEGLAASPHQGCGLMTIQGPAVTLGASWLFLVCWATGRNPAYNVSRWLPHPDVASVEEAEGLSPSGYGRGV